MATVSVTSKGQVTIPKQVRQAYDFHTPCEAFGNLRQRQDVCRAGEQEAARTAIVVEGSVGRSAKA